MKLGLLLCDHVDAQFQDEFGDYPEMFAAWLPAFDVVPYDVIRGEFPVSAEECEVYMTTGSRHSVYEKLQWIFELQKFLREIEKADKYFVGICFGHQLIGETFGGRVKKSTEGWCVSVHNFVISKKERWMIPSVDHLNLLMMCQDQIIVLPEKAVLLAGNQHCKNAMIKLGDRILGVQAHPEFPKAFVKVLMEKRRNRIGGELFEDGLTRLKQPLDADVFAEWVERFVGLRH